MTYELDPDGPDTLTTYRQENPMATTTYTHVTNGIEVEVTRNRYGASCQAIGFSFRPVEVFNHQTRSDVWAASVNWSGIGSQHPTIATAYAACIAVAAGIAAEMNKENQA